MHGRGHRDLREGDRHDERRGQNEAGARREQRSTPRAISHHARKLDGLQYGQCLHCPNPGTRKRSSSHCMIWLITPTIAT